MQKADGRKFEEIFSRYLEQKHGTVKSFNEPDEGLDFIYIYKDLPFYFELKIYSSDFAVEQNLHRECRKLIKKEGIGGRRVILAVANLVSDEVKNACKYEYDIFIWDVRNLLWLFEEFPAIKNEFVALLNYTIDAIAPKKPEFYIFEGTEEKPEHPVFEGAEEKSESEELKEKLRKIKPGKEQWRQYEEFCKTMLVYVLGDYLALWQSQENTDNGLYRFDLCCKIKDRVNQDFFNTIRQYFNTKYIVFEFKNNSEKITQKEIYTTEKYLYEKALRKVAIIISRKGADENALAAARGSFRESGKLILCLSDKEVIALINMKEKNEQPTGLFFEAMLDDLLIHLEK